MSFLCFLVSQLFLTHSVYAVSPRSLDPSSNFLAPRTIETDESFTGIGGFFFPWTGFTGIDQLPLLQYDGDGDGRTWYRYAVECIGSFAIWFCLMMCAYFCCYRYQCPVPEKKEDAEAGTKVEKIVEDILHGGHFQCMQDSNICICSFCCFGLRWADTTSLAGFLSFWVALFCISVMAFLNAAMMFILFGIFTSTLILYFRHKLRRKLGVEAWTLGTCCIDLVYVCCCPCCAISQEARIVKEAIEGGHEGFLPEEI